MKTVVAISSGDIARMVAMSVMQRPENMGRVATVTELAHNAVGAVEARITLYDSLEEAQAAVQAGAPKATVLSMVKASAEALASTDTAAPVPPSDLP